MQTKIAPGREKFVHYTITNVDKHIACISTIKTSKNQIFLQKNFFLSKILPYSKSSCQKTLKHFRDGFNNRAWNKCQVSTNDTTQHGGTNETRFNYVVSLVYNTQGAPRTVVCALFDVKLSSRHIFPPTWEFSISLARLFANTLRKVNLTVRALCNAQRGNALVLFKAFHHQITNLFTFDNFVRHLR